MLLDMKKLFFLAIIAIAAVSCAPKDQWKAEHVIIIGLDGWGSYSVEKADMPNVQSLMSKGCFTLGKRAVLPSSSAVNWATMFMGANPEVHGHTEWNSYTPEIPSYELSKNDKFPTVFQLIDQKYPEVEMGAIFEWHGIEHVIDSLAFDYHEQATDFGNHPEKLGEMAVDYILAKKPNLGLFVYDNPDGAGHRYGHDSPEYYTCLTQLDAYIGKIIDAVKEAGMYDDTIFIVTSDHGGINKGHGGKSLMEIETPFIIAGKGIKKGGLFARQMMQFDFAATVAEIFSVETPDVWRAKSMSQVFE
jgi:predicted AlkP superfamily pyrophosphatase or phosphodiesterase